MISKILLCTAFVLFAVTAQSQVTAFPPSPLILCDDNNPGDQMEIFDLTSKIPEIIGSQTNVVVTFHPSSGAALSGIMAYNNTTAFQNSVNPETVFVRVRNANNSSDFDVTTLELNVPLIPEVVQNPADITEFDADGNGFEVFDLTQNENQALGEQDPFLFNFYYYTTQADADAMVNPIANPTAFVNMGNPQTIFVAMTNIEELCYFSQYTFNIEAVPVLGLNQFNEGSFLLLPNPASENLTIQSQLIISEAIITMYDIQGKKLFSETRMPQNGSITIDVSAFVKGMYFVEISSEGNSFITKLIVK